MRELTIAEAERIAGERLDRRMKYATTDDGQPDEDGFDLFSLAKWTSPCSGCSPEDPYWNGDRGIGCSECGHTGKRRNAVWVPHLMDNHIESVNFRYPAATEARLHAEKPSAGSQGE